MTLLSNIVIFINNDAIIWMKYSYLNNCGETLKMNLFLIRNL